MNKYSEWFNGEKYIPNKAGVYERKYSYGVYRCRWDGKYWYGGAESISKAKLIEYTALNQDLPFRGLSENPNVKT